MNSINIDERGNSKHSNSYLDNNSSFYNDYNKNCEYALRNCETSKEKIKCMNEHCLILAK